MRNVHTLDAMAASDLHRWMGVAMCRAREVGGLSHVDIASLAKVREPKTVRRWEKGENWPQQLNLVLQIYAEAGNYRGARELCEAALRLWREHDEDPATQFEGEAERAAPPPDGHGESSSADPRAADAEGEVP